MSENFEIFIIEGSVKNKDGSVAKGLTVKAFDYDSNESKLLGQEVMTNDQGNYQINYSTDLLIKPEAKKPNLLIQVLSDTKIVATAKRQNASAIETINLIYEPEEPSGYFAVKGNVKIHDGTPAKGIAVIASDFDPKISKLLGEAVTNDEGYYAIEYKANQLVNPVGKSPHLIVQAKMEGKVVAAARKQNAGPIEFIDLNLPEPVEQPVETFTVEGSARYRNNSPAINIAIRAFDYDPVNPSTVKQLGQHTQTDNQGYYRIEYKVSELLKPDDKMPNLLVQAIRYNNVVTTHVQALARQIEVIDLIIQEKFESF